MRFPHVRPPGTSRSTHLDPWAGGGATDLDRLVCLCPFHHDAHHRGEFTITGSPLHPDRLLQQASVASAVRGLVFTNRRGLVLGAPDFVALNTASTDPTDPTDPAESHLDAYRGPTGERLHTRWLDLRPNRPELSVVPDLDPYLDIPPPSGAGPPGEQYRRRSSATLGQWPSVSAGKVHEPSRISGRGRYRRTA